MIRKIITGLMEDSEVSEVLMNTHKNIMIKKGGEYFKVDFAYESEEQYLNYVKEFIEENEMGDGRYLAEGRVEFHPGVISRVHITMPPTSYEPQITVAKRTQSLKTLESIQLSGTFNVNVGLFLRAMIDTKLTAVISGSAGAGKTTLLEALTMQFGDDERVGICEDLPELVLRNENAVYLHSTVWRPGMDKNQAVPLSWVVQQINRQRVERIIVGEIRGPEFYDFLIAVNSGIEGGLTSIHANDPELAVKKMTMLASQGVNMDIRLINEMIANNIDIVIQIDRDPNGVHYNKITRISYVTNRVSDKSAANITLHPLFTYDRADDNWIQHPFDDHLTNYLVLNGYNPKTFVKTVAKQDPTSSRTGLPNYFKGE